MLNSVTLMGRLVQDPDLRTTQSNISVCRFSLAVDRNFSGQGQEKKTDFINCVAWRQQADFISKYFRKGQMMALQGSLYQDSYTDRDGNKRTSYTVSVERAYFCGSKSESGSGSANYNQHEQNGSSYQNASADDFSDVPNAEDDLPF